MAFSSIQISWQHTQNRFVVDKYIIGATIVVALVALAWWGMYRSWKRRSAASAAVTTAWESRSVGPIPALDSTFSVFYVATTPTDSPLERLNLPGLSFRARATVTIFSDTIVVEPQGEVATAISPSAFLGVRTTQVSIDRVVEKDGLTAVDWVAINAATGERTLVSSVFRVPNIRLRERFESALEAFGTSHPPTVNEVSS